MIASRLGSYASLSAMLRGKGYAVATTAMLLNVLIAIASAEEAPALDANSLWARARVQLSAPGQLGALSTENLVETLLDHARANEDFETVDSSYVYATWLVEDTLSRRTGSEGCSWALEQLATLIEVRVAHEARLGRGISWRPNNPPDRLGASSMEWHSLETARALLRCEGDRAGALLFFEDQAYATAASSGAWDPYVEVRARLRIAVDAAAPEYEDALRARLARAERRLRYRYLPLCQRTLADALQKYREEHGTLPSLSESDGLQNLLSELALFLPPSAQNLDRNVRLVEYSSLTGRLSLDLLGGEATREEER